MLILYIQHLLCSLVQVYIIFYAYNKTLILYCILIEGLYYQSINLFHTMQYIVLVYTENNNILRKIHSIHDIYIYTHINTWCG